MPVASLERADTNQSRAELEKVLASPAFIRSPTLAHFLSYVCEKTLAGESEHLKEYSIALEVFGRHESFDQDTDSIVRVQANRLRKKLAEYYKGEGADDPLQIVIPVGQYVPRFEPKVPSAASPPEGDTPQQSAFWTRQKSVVLAALLTCITLVFLRSRVRQHETFPPHVQRSATSTTFAEPIGLPIGDEIRILAGANHSYVDRAGKLWSPDRFFSGGQSVRSSVQHIWRTQDPNIYRSSRQGDFRYDIPLKPGIYELRLHFAEVFYGPEEIGSGGEGSRIMTAKVNSNVLIDEFDVLLDAGGSRTADVKVFTGIAPAADGQLHVAFSSLRGGSATLSAIEILPGLRGKQRPVRITTRDVPYYSNDSLWWAPDDYFKGGQMSSSDETAIDTDDAEMFEAERWGHFSYAIPVAPGHYIATFYFIEHRFDSANRDRYSDTASAERGGRLFNVFCNGKAILREVDLIKEVGANRPMKRRVSGLEPNAQGKLLLEFVPTRSYATVTAIEIIPQDN
jgi:hypothetical protein